MKDHNKDIDKNKADSQHPDQNWEESQSIKIPVIEEQINIDKKIEETGKVRLTKKVHEVERIIDTPSVQEEVNVERIAINKYVESAPPPVRHEGDTTIISVLREVTVVEKRLELVEEVRITKRRVKSDSSQRVSLRREEVNVERINNDKIDNDRA